MTYELRFCCKACDHEWVAAKLPIDAKTLVALTRHAACPRCGAKGKDLSIPFGGKPTLAERDKS